MAPDPELTRSKLLDAATRLFAARGIFGVSLAEITKAAGQRNASALHYHFGSREAVLGAIIERHAPAIRDRRLELLAVAAERPGELRPAVEALVLPMTEFVQRGWRERAFVRIGVELATGPDRVSPGIRTALARPGGSEVFELIGHATATVPEAIRRERFRTVSLFIGRATADRALLLDTWAPGDEAVLDDAAFVANLVDMAAGALGAPVSAALDALGGGPGGGSARG